MHFKYIAKNLGIMLSSFSLTMLPPLFLSAYYHEKTMLAFSISWFSLLSLGFFLWFPLRFEKYDPRVREGFLIVVIYWFFLCLIGALPFFIADNPDISFVDAVFESVSGLTATGATVFTNLDIMPKSIIYYRQQLQFLGGMGILLLAVAILPTLGVGGMQLFRAEVTGPNKDAKITPKIAETAKSLWLIYISIALLCAISYYSCGMSWFDAICYSFGTVSTGGYAPHDTSIDFYLSDPIKIVATIFMVLGAMSFTLHYFSIRHTSLTSYRKNTEVKFFFITATLVSLLVWTYISFMHDKSSSIVDTVFQTVSLMTTTGFMINDYTQWPIFCTFMLLFLGVIGGCAGSTSGGVKIARVIIIFKHSAKEIQKILHPRSYCQIKFNQSPVSLDILYSITGFLCMFIILYFVFTFMILATGLDLTTATSAVAACIGNVGPGLGGVASNFQEISDYAKVILSVAMITGRLELFPILVLLSPLYWKN